jgi:hypothetical protein
MSLEDSLERRRREREEKRKQHDLEMQKLEEEISAKQRAKALDKQLSGNESAVSPRPATSPRSDGVARQPSKPAISPRMRKIDNRSPF